MFMVKNRYLNTQDHRRDMMDGRRDMGEPHEKYARFNQYLERQKEMDMRSGMDGRRDMRDMRDMTAYPTPHTMSDYRYGDGNYGYDKAYDMAYSKYDARSDRRYDGKSDYANDYGEHHHKISEEKYCEDIERWTEKLKKKDRFKVSKENIINQAKQMGIKFDEFSEEEFYVVYLMHISDYKNVANDHRMYISMAKDWLEDDDIEVTPSEKICVHFYGIVKGKPIKF